MSGTAWRYGVAVMAAGATMSLIAAPPAGGGVDAADWSAVTSPQGLLALPAAVPVDGPPAAVPVDGPPAATAVVEPVAGPTAKTDDPVTALAQGLPTGVVAASPLEPAASR